MVEKYRDWKILNSLPNGWVIDKTAGSPLPRTVFITNGKSVLNGQKRALLKVESKLLCDEDKKQDNEKHKYIGELKKEKPIEQPFPVKTINDLARKKFQEQILKEILFDLMVCEIEGWDKKQYIKEIKTLISSIDLTTKHSSTNKQQLSLF